MLCSLAVCQKIDVDFPRDGRVVVTSLLGSLISLQS